MVVYTYQISSLYVIWTFVNILQNAVKKRFFGLFRSFLNVAPTEVTALKQNFRWTYWSMCIVNIPNVKSLHHLDVCQHAAKCSENAVFVTFLTILNVAHTKMTALTRNFRWTNWGTCIVYLPNFKSLSHLDVC